MTVPRLKKADWEVRPVSIQTARRLVEEYHYSKGASNTATYLHGLFRRGDLLDTQCAGVAWWIPPTKTAAHHSYPKNWRGVLTLSRMVIRPDVPANACSFLLARSSRMIDRSRWPCLTTYADEAQGHTGAIYLAANWKYVGKTKPERFYLTDSGRMVARKAGGVTRKHQQMLDLGFRLGGTSAKHKFCNISETPNTTGETSQDG